MVCVRCIVSGRVQGVFFRESTRREAEKLGITGYAINLRDGSVEVLACGAVEAVDRLREWLWVGPPAAQVRGVDCKNVNETAPGRFTTA